MVEVDVTVKSWWSFLVKGLVALAFGIVMIAYPGATARTFFMIFGIFLLAYGAIDMARGVYHLFKKEKWISTFAWGALDFLIAGIVLSHLDQATVGFLWVISIIIGIWVLVMGVFECVAAFEMPSVTGRGWLGTLGVLSLIFGVIILAVPFETIYALMVVLGIYLIVVGVIDIGMSVYVPLMTRKIKKEVKSS